jgi:peptidyl-prolyl cis-trans isomerase C
MLRTTALAALLAALAAPLHAQTDETEGAPQAQAAEGAEQGGPETPAQMEAETRTEEADTATGQPTGTAGQEAPVPADLDRVLATANGTDITLGHVVLARRALPEQFQQIPDAQLLPGLVDQLVQQTLLAGALEDEARSVTLQIENETRNLRAAAALSGHLEETLTEEDLRAAYEERVAGQEPGTEYRASHILLETEEEARSVIEEIEGGADFADVARARSTGPSAPRGGDLGFFAEGAMVPPFEAAVQALEPGAISEPVQTQFGFHVIRLEETREAEAPSFEQTAPQIAQELQREAVETYLAELTAAADVTREPLEGIDPSVLSTAEID